MGRPQLGVGPVCGGQCCMGQRGPCGEPQEEAKRIIDERADEIILDVREPEEYDSGHIHGAILLPVGLIDEECAEAVIPAKDAVVLVYCRSGNRSKTASAALAGLGYTNILEFGGINTWPYGTE